MTRRTPLSPAHTILSTLAALGLATTAAAGFATSAQAAETPGHGTVMADASQAAARSVAAANRQQLATRAAVEQNIRNTVVTKALAQIGDQYGAGGDGPNVFDCSGLVVYAWRTVGVKLDHYSYAQYKQTERISLKNAVPGDLAFYFRNGAHHVALYIGNGKVVQAADYGIGVITGTVKGSPWTRAHFSGMGRVKIPG